VCKPRPDGRQEFTTKIRIPLLQSNTYVDLCSLCTGRMVAVESTFFQPSEPPSGGPGKGQAFSPNSLKRVGLFSSQSSERLRELTLIRQNRLTAKLPPGAAKASKPQCQNRFPGAPCGAVASGTVLRL